MKSIILTVVVLYCTTTVSLAQSMSNSSKTNNLELYFPISHFFDETNTNWLLLARHRSNFVYDTNGNLVDYNEKYILPATVGIQFSRKLNTTSKVRISTTLYFRDYGYDREKERGEVIKRKYALISIGYLYTPIGNSKLKINLIGEINYRMGSETIHIYYPSPFEGKVETINLNNIGCSSGIKVERYLPLNFIVSGEIKYTHYVYRHSDGIDFFGQHKDATPNTLSIKLGLGYQF